VRKVLVVSDSPALRETIDIVLGDRFEVDARSVVDAPARLDADVALVVVDAQSPVPAGDAAVLSLGDGRFRSLAAGRRRQYLPAAFDPQALREAAEMLVAAAPATSEASAPASVLQPPFLPAAIAEIARRAVRAPLPLCIWGEAGTGKLRLVHAIHAERGAAYLHVLSACEANAADILIPQPLPPRADVTLAVNGLEDLDAAGQRRVRAALEAGHVLDAAGQNCAARLIVTARREPAALVRENHLDRDLLYRIGVLTLPLLPLRERSGDIAELARTLAAALCDRLGLPKVSFTPAALRRLGNYLWFGNLAELEAVVARSIVFASQPEIDTRDLRFGYGEAMHAALAPSAASADPARAPGSNGEAVDLIIHELAHEFKNPMVTIKTFAHQLDHLQEGNGGQDEFARLTGEAVERMDAALENLVQYTRFDTPTPQPTALGTIVGSALGGVEDFVAEKQLALDVEPTAAQVLVDPAQCGYALRNLLRAVARDLSHGDSLAVRASGPASLRIEYPARAGRVANSLSRLVAGEEHGHEALPLGFSFAKSLIERNGGHLDVDRSGDVARVTLEFPPVGT